MSWKTFRPQTDQGNKAQSIRIGVRRAPRSSLLVAMISIGGFVAETLGVEEGDRISLDIGEGEHAGKVRLIRNKEGSFVLKSSGHSKGRGKPPGGAPPNLFISVKGLPGAEPCQTRSVRHSEQGETVIFTLPWAEAA